MFQIMTMMWMIGICTRYDVLDSTDHIISCVNFHSCFQPIWQQHWRSWGNCIERSHSRQHNAYNSNVSVLNFSSLNTSKSQKILPFWWSNTTQKYANMYRGLKQINNYPHHIGSSSLCVCCCVGHWLWVYW